MSAPIKGVHRSQLLQQNKNGVYEENMFISDIGRPSQPISWILDEINRRVRIQHYDEESQVMKYVSPNLQELDYANELSEIALEYVDEIILMQEPYDNINEEIKRVSTQSFIDKKRAHDSCDI